MRQHRHRLVAIVQSFLMGTDIHAIGQATDHEHLWTHLSEVEHKSVNQILAILCTLTGAHNIHDLRLVQVSIASIINDNRGISALSEPLGIIIV